MKKTITVFALLALLFSCGETEAEIEQGKKDTADLVSQITDQVVEKGEERKAEAAKESSVSITKESLDQDCQIEKIFSEGGEMFVSLRTFDLEPIANPDDPENPIARILIGETVKTFRLSSEKYTECSQEHDATIEELKAAWNENTDIPMHVKAVDGVVTEFYKDACS